MSCTSQYSAAWQRLSSTFFWIALAFRVLTPKQVEWRALLPGAISGGIAWTILQTLGTYVVGHDLKGSSALYGTFGLVLGLMAWIFLGAQITVYAAFINPVLTYRLWPRAIVQPPLTEADQHSMALLATQNQMRPEQEVQTRFHQSPMDQGEFRERGYRSDDSGGFGLNCARQAKKRSQILKRSSEVTRTCRGGQGHSPSQSPC